MQGPEAQHLGSTRLKKGYARGLRTMEMAMWMMCDGIDTFNGNSDPMDDH